MTDTPNGPEVGLKIQETLTVESRHTVPHVGSDWRGFSTMPEVFATAMMVAFTEETCIRALEGLLEPGQKTVGIHIDMSHSKATPTGMTVTVDAELVKVEGRKLTFKVIARDDHHVIGEGTHQRAIIDRAAFEQAVAEKAQTS